MPNLVKKFRVEVGFLWGGGPKFPPAQLELKNTPRDIGLKNVKFSRNVKRDVLKIKIKK